MNTEKTVAALKTASVLILVLGLVITGLCVIFGLDGFTGSEIANALFLIASAGTLLVACFFSFVLQFLAAYLWVQSEKQ